MAIFSCNLQGISRGAGKSAVASVAYRLGIALTDERTGQVHDYRRKAGILHTSIVLPPGCAWKPTHAELWNTAERSENRKNSQVARELEYALPCELTSDQRNKLAEDIAQKISYRLRVAGSLGVHAPSRRRSNIDAPGGDQRNFHGHFQITTRIVVEHGLGAKTRELDLKASATEFTNWMRHMLAETTNEHLAAAGHDARIDHRSLKNQGVERVAEPKVGVAAIQMARRGVKSERLEAWREVREANERLAHVKAIDDQIDGLSARLAAAKLEGERERLAQAVASIDVGTDITSAKNAARLPKDIRPASDGPHEINNARPIRTESHAQTHTKTQDTHMRLSKNGIPAMRLPKLPHMAGKGILCSWIDQLSVREDQASRMLALALFNNLFNNVIEKAGYRARLKASQPDRMAELERHEAAQARFDKIKKMDPAAIIRLTPDEQHYLERIRQLQADATLEDVRRVDVGMANKIRASAPGACAKLLDRYSPAALISTNGYGANVIADAVESERQCRESRAGELNEVIGRPYSTYRSDLLKMPPRPQGTK